MTYQEIIDYYGTPSAVAKSLGLSVTAVTDWKKKIQVPLGRQAQIAALSNGALSAETTPHKEYWARTKKGEV